MSLNWTSHKIQSVGELKRQRSMLQGQVVFTNGCFDILHVGHIRYLQLARNEGQYLIVGLNSDQSVKAIKGYGRPIIPELERAEMLAALCFVDYVCIFHEDSPYELIHVLEPDILVKGGDWPKEKIIGRDLVESRGGKVLTIPFVKDKSTTNIILTIKKLV